MTFGKLGPRNLVKQITARSYVQNGLVAMWDGIENDGYGAHDDTPVIWWNSLVSDACSLKARINNSSSEWVFTGDSGYIVSDRFIAMTGNGTTAWMVPFSSDKTMRFVAKMPDSMTASDSLICGFMTNNATRHVIGISQNGGCVYISHRINLGTAAKKVVIGDLAGLTCSINMTWKASTRTLKAYLNGALVATLQIPQAEWEDSNWDSADESDRKLHFSGQNSWTPYDSQANAVKFINIAIYDRVLTDEQILLNQVVDELRLGLSSPWKNPYVQDGLVVMWDGIFNAGSGMRKDSPKYWVSVVGNDYMPDRKFYSDSTAINGPSGTSLGSASTNNYRITGDFTLHSCVRTPDSKSWAQFCLVGIGTSSFLVMGFTLNAYSNTGGYLVVYQTKYGNEGNIGARIDTGKGISTDFSLDVVFQYASKTFLVYVNGQYVSEYEIPQESWVLDGVDLKIGASSYGGSLSYESGFRQKNVLYYGRALTADEIAANYAIDKARFNLP